MEGKDRQVATSVWLGCTIQLLGCVRWTPTPDWDVRGSLKILCRALLIQSDDADAEILNIFHAYTLKDEQLTLRVNPPKEEIPNLEIIVFRFQSRQGGYRKILCVRVIEFCFLFISPFPRIIYNASISATEKAAEWPWALHLLQRALRREVPVDVITHNAAISAVVAEGGDLCAEFFW